MTEDQVLDAASERAATITQAETELIEIAYHWAVLHSADRLDPRESARPGRERVKQLGGPGTPEVSEFAAAELGARIGRSPYAAARLIGDALDLYNRLPQLWARVQAGEVRASYARHVTKMTRDLEPAEAAYVDAAVVESADGRIAWSRFEALVEAKVAQAAPAAAREAEERATIDTLEAAVAAEADRGDPDVPTDVRRVQAVLTLMTGSPVAAPHVQLYVHTYAGPDREDIARVEGHGPVTQDWVRELLGPKAKFTIRPVLDLAGQAPVDAYEIPDRHRQAVHLMTPADTFPHATCTTRQMQVDHTTPHEQGGVSGVGNYGPMTTTHHRIKTHTRWQVKQPFPGIYLWRDPHGAHYLVDHTGTRRLPTTTSPPRTNPVVVEIWRPAFDLEYAPAA